MRNAGDGRTLDSRYHSIQILLSSGISCVTVLKYCNFLLSSLGCSFKKLTLVVNNTALWQLQRRENVQIFALKCLSTDTFLVLGLGLIREPKNEIPKSPQLNCNGVNHFPGTSEPEGGWRKANMFKKWIFCLRWGLNQFSNFHPRVNLTRGRGHRVSQ